MCNTNKYIIECLENGKYRNTCAAVFETRELAREYIHLYLEGRKNCTFIVRLIDYFYE